MNIKKRDKRHDGSATRLRAYVILFILIVLQTSKCYSLNIRFDSSGTVIECYFKLKKNTNSTYKYLCTSYLPSFLVTGNDKGRVYDKLRNYLTIPQFDSLIETCNLLSKKYGIDRIYGTNIKNVSDSELKIISRHQSLTIIIEEPKKCFKKRKNKILDNPYDSSILYYFSAPVIFNDNYCIIRIDYTLGLGNSTHCTYLFIKDENGVWEFKEIIACQYG